MEIGDEDIETEPRVYQRKPHTHPTNKLRLSFNSNLNPKLKEPVIIDEEENVMSSKGKEKATE